MKDPGDSSRSLPPSVASGRSWWFWGGFAGVRYQAALRIRVLEPEPSGPAAELLRAVAPPVADARRGRTALEVWEGEGGAVGE